MRLIDGMCRLRVGCNQRCRIAVVCRGALLVDLKPPSQVLQQLTSTVASNAI